jgi:hypothetical protein
MKTKVIGRKRSLALVGCCWLSPSVLRLLCNTASTATISGFQQHSVPPTRRHVQYYDDRYQTWCNDCVDVRNEFLTDSTTSSPMENQKQSDVPLNDDNVIGSIWHIHADANNIEEDVDVLFASLRRMHGNLDPHHENNKSSRFSSTHESSALKRIFTYIKGRKLLGRWRCSCRFSQIIGRKKLCQGQ